MTEQKRVQTRIPSVLDDPGARAVARVYADAFLNAAATGVEAALEEFQSFQTDVLDANPDFEAVLLSAMIHRDKKLELIDRAVRPHASEMFTSFLRVLARHERLNLLRAILREGLKQQEYRMGRRPVTVTSAAPLPDTLTSRIRQRLTENLPFEPVIHYNTDPSLLGGLMIRIEDTVYDSSLRTRLRQLSHRLRERSLYEIQSGRDRFSHPEGD